MMQIAREIFYPINQLNFKTLSFLNQISSRTHKITLICTAIFGCMIPYLMVFYILPKIFIRNPPNNNKLDTIEKIFEKSKNEIFSRGGFDDSDLINRTQSKLFLVISHNKNIFQESFVFSSQVNRNQVSEKINQLFDKMKSQISFDDTKKTSVRMGMLLKENTSEPLYGNIYTKVEINNGEIRDPFVAIRRLHSLQMKIVETFCSLIGIPDSPHLDSQGNFI